MTPTPGDDARPHDALGDDESTRVSRRETRRADESADVTAPARRRDPDATTAPGRRAHADASGTASPRPEGTTVRVRPARTADPAITAERPLVRTASIPDGVFASSAPREPDVGIARRGAPDPRRAGGPVDGDAVSAARRRRHRRRVVLLVGGVCAGALVAGVALALLLIG